MYKNNENMYTYECINLTMNIHTGFDLFIYLQVFVHRYSLARFSLGTRADSALGHAPPPSFLRTLPPAALGLETRRQGFMRHW